MMKIWQIAVPLALYSITSAIFFPVSQSFIYWKLCTGSTEYTGLNVSDCGNRTVSSSNQYLQTEANRIFLIGSIVMTLTAIVSGTVLGKIGDEKSRKLATFVPFVGLLLADGVLIFLCYSVDSSPYLYVLSEAVFGLCGGYVTILSSSFAYGSHQAKKAGHERSRAIAYLEGAIGFGSVIGFLCTSMIKSIGYLNAYMAMTGIHVVCIFFILIMDDIRPSPDADTDRKRKNICMRLSEKLTSWRQLFKIKDNRKRLLVLISAFALSFFAFIGTVHIMFFYLKQRFHWDLKLYAYLKAPHQMASTLAVLFLFPFLKTKVKMSDPGLALLGLLSRFLGRIWLAISWNTNSVYFLIILDSMSRFSPTAIRSMLSKTAASDEQGRIFSLISVVELVFTLLASVVFHTLFPYSISFFPQMSFVIMGVIVVPAIALIWFYKDLLTDDVVLVRKGPETGENVPLK